MVTDSSMLNQRDTSKGQLCVLSDLNDADTAMDRWTAMKYFSQMPYDVITTGNHELYKYPTALSTYQTLVQHYGRHYLTSNVNITLPSVDGAAPVSVPIGHQYAKFKTEQGRDVTALGPLFFFKAHAPGTTVQHPREMIKESWFLDAISEQPDFFLLGMYSISDAGYITDVQVQSGTCPFKLKQTANGPQSSMRFELSILQLPSSSSVDIIMSVSTPRCFRDGADVRS
jgi:hypothetical protein